MWHRECLGCTLFQATSGVEKLKSNELQEGLQMATLIKMRPCTERMLLKTLFRTGAMCPLLNSPDRLNNNNNYYLIIILLLNFLVQWGWLREGKKPLERNTAIELWLFQPLPWGPRLHFSQMIGTCSPCLTETFKLQEDPWTVLSTWGSIEH